MYSLFFEAVRISDYNNEQEEHCQMKIWKECQARLSCHNHGTLHTLTYKEVSKPHKNFKTAEVLAEIQTEQLLNINLGHYCYNIVFGMDVVHILKWFTKYRFGTPSMKYFI